MIYLASGLVLIGISFLVYVAAFAARAGRISQKIPALPPDAVVTHTYCPKHSEVPKRGRLAAEAGSLLAYRFHIPLVLAVGHTVPNETRMESEIYRDYVEKHFADRLPEIILGRNPAARDTHAETGEAARLAKEKGWRRLLIVGLTPHLVRIRGYWKEYEPDFTLSFTGVAGPKKYYLWESLMFILEIIFPPGSYRRTTLLDLAGRRK